MKKILHISKYYYPFRGGTEQIAQNCINSLSDTYEQKVICFNHDYGEKREYIDSVEIIRCKCFAKVCSQSLSVSYGKNLKKVLDSFRPDIVIFHYPNPFVSYYLLRFLPDSIKLAVYWHLDIVKQRILGKLFVWQNKKLLKRANLVIATSQRYVEGSSYLKAVAGKCKIVPNCIDESRLKPTNQSKALAQEIRKSNIGKIICVAVGRHTEYKGFKYLIQASKMLDERFLFFIIGKGELTDKLKAEAATDKKIRFLGMVSDDELKAYLSVMDIFCFPSITKNEAFGVALAEGMYYEKPAVTFTIPGSGVNYVCLDGEDGIEVPNRDAETYAEALKKLADDPDLRNTYGKNGKRRVVNNFLDCQFKDNIHTVIDDM